MKKNTSIYQSRTYDPLYVSLDMHVNDQHNLSIMDKTKPLHYISKTLIEMNNPFSLMMKKARLKSRKHN